MQCFSACLAMKFTAMREAAHHLWNYCTYARLPLKTGTDTCVGQVITQHPLRGLEEDGRPGQAEGESEHKVGIAGTV
jgi:hypothetical protein